MKKSALILTLALSISLVACGNDKDDQKLGNEPNQTELTENEQVDNTPDEVVEEDKDLKDLSNWSGTWGSMTVYLDDPAIDEAFEQVADKEGTDLATEKNNYDAKRAVDFNGIKFEGDTVTFYDQPEYQDGKELTSATYNFDKVVEDKQTWYVYKANEEDATYPVLYLMQTDNDSGLHHFHMRYGNSDEEIMEKDSWYPGFVDPDTTVENIVGDILD